MSEICDEARAYAQTVDPETAERLLHLADWIDIQQATINEQRHVIAGLRRARQAPPPIAVR